MKRIFIEPLDVLMFRSSRPFTARETHLATSGPILPSIFAGALTTKILLNFCANRKLNPNNLQRTQKEGLEVFKDKIIELTQKNEGLMKVLELVGHPVISKDRKFKIKGVFFTKKNEYEEFFKLPNDIVYVNDKEKQKLQPKENLVEELSSDFEGQLMLSSQSIRLDMKDQLVDFKNLLKYLRGDLPTTLEDKPYKIERRTGIKLSSERTTEEGYLYVAEFFRLIEDWGFVAWCESHEEFLSDEGIIKLGGEGRGAYYSRIKEKLIDSSSIVQAINKEKRFKLYLATPAIFNDGWKISEDKVKNLLKNDEIELISALPGKPIYIGGYDVALNRQKPLRRGVDAGAVYYFKFNGVLGKDISFPIMVSDFDAELGFGSAFLGRW